MYQVQPIYPLYQPPQQPFSNWLDSGAIYDGSNSAASGLPSFNPSGLWTAPESPSAEKAAAFPPAGPNTVGALPISSASADLFKEFEDVLSQATGSLTPPDSPRSANGNLLQLPAHLNALPMSPPSQELVADLKGYIMLHDMASPPVVSDQLDELVAETFQKNSGGVAPAANEKSPGRPWDSPSASSSGSCDSGYEDPDWSPEKSAESTASPGNSSQSKKLRMTSTEERRLRKKEQNKNAATRYRMKKKMEMEEIIGEEKELLDRNENLKSEVVEITREIKYLKGLMGDLFRAKGLIRSK